MKESFRSGFVGIIGRPNVGKSTLLNTLARDKIAIISDKPQTTRHKIRCVLTRKEAQIIFIDTPGFHKPKDRLGDHLNRAVRSAFEEVDVILFIADASQVIGTGDCYIAGELEKLKTPVVLALNKADLIDKSYLEAQLEIGEHLGDFEDVVAISALRGDGVDLIVEKLIKFLPYGPKYYPENIITDQPEKVIIAEFIREKALQLTCEEVPYSIAVQVDEIKAREDKDLIDVLATIYVERESQKGIIIGKQGRMLKEIGSRARTEIQSLLGSQVYLELRVKVEKEWRKDEHMIRKLGYKV